MKSNFEDIQARLHHAEAIADLISVAESTHLCDNTLSTAAEAIRTLVQQAREMHAVRELDQNMPVAIRSVEDASEAVRALAA